MKHIGERLREGEAPTEPAFIMIQDELGSRGGSPSRQITSPEILIPEWRGADRARVSARKESHRRLLPGGRGVDRADLNHCFWI